jgi:CRP-like cAMP-binding protein
MRRGKCDPGDQTFMTAETSRTNEFLVALSALELELFRSHLASFELRVGDCLHYTGDLIGDVVFPHSGLVVMSIPLLDDAGAGGILIGRDGIVGAFAAAAAAPATCDAEVQIAGHASRMLASVFRHLLDENPAIRRLAAKFDGALLAQAQQTSLCNAVHPVEARICRWLLEVQDRCGGSKIPLTQATLAQMLGVRRTTVTLVNGHLEAAGILNCRRGFVEIISREKLEQCSCACHAHTKNYLTRLFAVPGEAETAGGRLAAMV